LIRPAQVGDRKAIEPLVDKFYRSLKPGRAQWLRPLFYQSPVAIAITAGLLLALIRHGFYSHAIALTILFVLALQAHQWSDRTLANFWVVESGGKVIGCAKLFKYSTHSEAYLVQVDAAWRGQGYGSCLVQRLTQEASLPLYLASQPHRLAFYKRLGFVTVPTNAVPLSIRVNLGLDRYKDANIQALVFKPGATTGLTNLDQRIVP
jgi:N-acetylglutamate synthase-like GNAT family acetyltransferase